MNKHIVKQTYRKTYRVVKLADCLLSYSLDNACFSIISSQEFKAGGPSGRAARRGGTLDPARKLNQETGPACGLEKETALLHIPPQQDVTFQKSIKASHSHSRKTLHSFRKVSKHPTLTLKKHYTLCTQIKKYIPSFSSSSWLDRLGRLADSVFTVGSRLDCPLKNKGRVGLWIGEHHQTQRALARIHIWPLGVWMPVFKAPIRLLVQASSHYDAVENTQHAIDGQTNPRSWPVAALASLQIIVAILAAIPR